MFLRCCAGSSANCSGSSRVSRMHLPFSWTCSRIVVRCSADFDAHITASSSPVRASRAKSSITSLCSVIDQKPEKRNSFNTKGHEGKTKVHEGEARKPCSKVRGRTVGSSNSSEGGWTTFVTLSDLLFPYEAFPSCSFVFPS